MPRDGRGHAETRIGVDVGRADVALHQLVGDVIIFRQDLAGNVEGDTVRTVFGNRGGEGFRHQIKRFIPGGPLAIDFGI